MFHRVQSKKKDSYPFQSAGFNHHLVLVRVHGLPEQDVAADGAGVDPGLLGGVGQLTFHLERALLCRQLSENGAQQRRLEESRVSSVAGSAVCNPAVAREPLTFPAPTGPMTARRCLEVRLKETFCSVGASTLCGGTKVLVGRGGMQQLIRSMEAKRKW